MAAFIGTPIAEFLQVNPLSVSGTLFFAPLAIKLTVSSILGYTPVNTTSFAFMAVQKEVWVDYIIENLFKDNSFLQYCFNESDNVLNGVVVHIPQAGAKPNVVKNRGSLPATVVQRTDTDVTYPLDSFTTDPILIKDAEKKEVSYDKMGSVLDEHIQALSETIGDYILNYWAPTTAATIIRTTGAADAVALSTGATGTRKALKATDLRKAQATMNKLGIPKNDRWALIPDDMLSQLLADTTLTASQIQLLTDLKEGQIARLFGFNILTRVNAGVYDNSGTPAPKSVGAASATSDNLAVLCWQKNAVAKAMGEVKFFERTDDPTFYGDVYSAEVRMGGRKRRAAAEGVVAIVQEA